MGQTVIADWTRNKAGYVSLVPVEKCAAGVTDHGDIALSLAGNSGGEGHCGQYVFSRGEAMSIAKALVRAVALADAQAWVRKVPEREKEMAG